jgi:hypothetical protein
MESPGILPDQKSGNPAMGASNHIIIRSMLGSLSAISGKT